MRVYLSYLNRKNTCQALSDRESLTKNLESLGFFDKTNFDKHKEKRDLDMEKYIFYQNWF